MRIREESQMQEFTLDSRWPEIEGALDSAKRLFLNSDQTLLEIDANERSLTHKFAEYLQPIFTSWNVDCEYNRNNGNSKRLHVLAPGCVSTDDTDANTVYPDIIVHRRASTDNLLVIEAKKAGRDKSFDRLKLQAFLDRDGFGYIYAASLEFIVGKKCGIKIERVDANS